MNRQCSEPKAGENDKNYVSFGFTSVLVTGEEWPQWAFQKFCSLRSQAN